eukprot:718405-Hanusia_phi.AAC.2
MIEHEGPGNFERQAASSRQPSSRTSVVTPPWRSERRSRASVWCQHALKDWKETYAASGEA